MNFFLFFLIPCIVHAASITISGNPQPLLISQAQAGSQPNSVIDTSTSYRIKVNNNETATISAAINSPLPNYTSLKVTFAAPPNATSVPSVAVTTAPQVLVSGIRKGNYSNLLITYEYLATVAAGVVSLSSKTLILTITSN